MYYLVFLELMEGDNSDELNLNYCFGWNSSLFDDLDLIMENSLPVMSNLNEKMVSVKIAVDADAVKDDDMEKSMLGLFLEALSMEEVGLL